MSNVVYVYTEFRPCFFMEMQELKILNTLFSAQGTFDHYILVLIELLGLTSLTQSLQNFLEFSRNFEVCQKNNIKRGYNNVQFWAIRYSRNCISTSFSRKMSLFWPMKPQINKSKWVLNCKWFFLLGSVATYHILRYSFFANPLNHFFLDISFFI